MLSRASLNVTLKTGNELRLEDAFPFIQSPLLVSFMLPQTFTRCHEVVQSSDGESEEILSQQPSATILKFRAEQTPTSLCIHLTSKEKFEEKMLTARGLGTLPDNGTPCQKVAGKARKRALTTPDTRALVSAFSIPAADALHKATEILWQLL